MKHVFIVLFSLFLFIGCDDSNQKVEVKEENQLVSILIDLQTAKIIIERAKEGKSDSLENLYWQNIEELHGNSRNEIETLLNKLKKQPEYLKSLYQKAEDQIDSLKKMNLKTE